MSQNRTLLFHIPRSPPALPAKDQGKEDKKKKDKERKRKEKEEKEKEEKEKKKRDKDRGKKLAEMRQRFSVSRWNQMYAISFQGVWKYICKLLPQLL